MSQQFVTRQQKDDSIEFKATLLDDDGLPITTGVTIDVLKPDDTFAAQDQSATHLGSGVWRYIVPASSVDQYGIWEAQWKWTVDSTDRRHRIVTRVGHL